MLLVGSLKKFVSKNLGRIQNCFLKITKPTKSSQVLETLSDITRSKSELILENALLRQQLIVLNRQVKRPAFKPFDRFLIVVLASHLKGWKQALLILKPDTLLRWHRAGFKLFWKFKSRPKSYKPKIGIEIKELIEQMARENPLWGAERIRGELLKLNIKVSKRTILKYIQPSRSPRPSGQNWKTFLKNHASDIRSCDFLPVTDIFFRQLYAFFLIEHSSRQIVHFGVTRHPTDEWVAQQLQEAIPYEQKPKYLIRDNDRKFGAEFERVASGAGIEILKTPIAAPKANAICERLLGSVRRESLDHFLTFGEKHLFKILKSYRDYYNRQRPHQGINQNLPESTTNWRTKTGKITRNPILGGLHHAYFRAA
jgi:transposase InsO family protein